MEYKKYTLEFSPKQNRHYTRKARPYDEAEYYWAYTYDQKTWTIVFNCKVEKIIFGTFEIVIDFIEEKNKNIKPIIFHW